MVPIELKKRYPHSRDEDITDAFMRGYQAHAEAVQGWIPCSEKLPSESGWYVISVVGLKNITDVSYFYSDESKWSDVSHTQTVTAWMPLPKPYREDGEV